MFLEKAILKKHELDALRPFESGVEERVMQKLRIDWNYHSNSIEGNSLTYGETKSLILHHITAEGKSLRDHFEITGHNDAINWVLDIVKGERDLTENFIRELHKLILIKNYTKQAITADGKPTTIEIKVGEYKKVPNHVKTVSGEVFYFAEPLDVPFKMNDLLNWYAKQIKDSEANPIILAAEFHYKFIRIHPFGDGNGRLARILMNFILLKFGYHPAVIKIESKEKYFEVLRIADGGNIEPFVEYIAETVFNSLDVMHKAILGIAFEDDNDVDKQFWLLNEKLKGLKKIEVVKNEESIENVINKVIIPLHDNILDSNKKFEEIYFEVTNHIKQWLHISNSPLPQSFYLKYIRELRNSENLKIIKSIDLVFLFDKLRSVTKSPIHYSFSFVINFQELFYEIILNDNKSLQKYFKKYYDEFFSEQELKNIVIEITKEHISYIDSNTKINNT